MLLHGLRKELKGNNPNEVLILTTDSHANLGQTGYRAIKEEFCSTQYCKILCRVFFAHWRMNN